MATRRAKTPSPKKQKYPKQEKQNQYLQKLIYGQNFQVLFLMAFKYC